LPSGATMTKATKAIAIENRAELAALVKLARN
jgi:hypothetical protein